MPPKEAIVPVRPNRIEIIEKIVINIFFIIIMDAMPAYKYSKHPVF